MLAHRVERQRRQPPQIEHPRGDALLGQVSGHAQRHAHPVAIGHEQHVGRIRVVHPDLSRECQLAGRRVVGEPATVAGSVEVTFVVEGDGFEERHDPPVDRGHRHRGPQHAHRIVTP